MRIVIFLLSALVTIGLIVVCNIKLNLSGNSIPPVGFLLSPSHGLWKNAEPVNADFNLDLQTDFLKSQVKVSFDDRLVPHVFAQSDNDAFFVQGYLHAKFRLWQMEFQTHAAAGRLSEILGEKIGDNSVLEGHDRLYRRLGMVYAAENALKVMLKDDTLSQAINAYTAGANHFIASLKPADYPIEYKLLDYAPELWTPMKSALLLKYMSYDLARDLDDLEYTNLKNHLGMELMEKAFPIMPDSLEPITPRGTRFIASVPNPLPPAGFQSEYLDKTDLAEEGFSLKLPERHPDVGSNNWVVGGIKTASGRPILCNDPHLSLNLPSLWYEIQIHTPQYNTYGVSFPGAPGIVIGFNDSIAWGVTNAMRDVMDFYEVRFRDSTMNEYSYNGEWVKTEWRTEVIRVREMADFAEKIPMTVWGPVIFDATYPVKDNNGKAYAVRWMAHDGSAEMKTFLKLNRAKNYNDFLEAIKLFVCPGQNFVFASKTNDIAWWQQAEFPAKWRRQGDYMMPGWDSSYSWQYSIPQQDNLNMVNPIRGFVSTANQLPADSTYPFYLGGVHDVYRGIIINRLLGAASSITPEMMQTMQNDNYNVFAEMAMPFLLSKINHLQLSPSAKEHLGILMDWNLRADIEEKGMTLFYNWWNEFCRMVWLDNITRPDSLPVPFPADHTLLEALIRDTGFVFVDNINTPHIETLSEVLTASFNKVSLSFEAEPQTWGQSKATGVRHLLKIMPFSSLNLPIGGGAKIINATTGNHGPSWRVVVHMTDETEAYGVYPGGQQGNPGSKYYDQFVDTWVKGQYNKLWFMKPLEQQSKEVKWTMNFK